MCARCKSTFTAAVQQNRTMFIWTSSVHFPRLFLYSNITPLRFTGKRASGHHLNVLFVFEKKSKTLFLCLIFVFHILLPLRRETNEKLPIALVRLFHLKSSMHGVYTYTYFYVLTYKNIRRYTLQTNPGGRHASDVISARNNSIVVLPPGRHCRVLQPDVFVFSSITNTAVWRTHV